jgi:hypothetical protein
MNRRISGWVAVLSLACCLTGCNTGRTDRFDVELRNGTGHPLTISLAKEGSLSPHEEAWMTPEEVALDSPKARERWVDAELDRGWVVPAGQVWMRRFSGQFSSGARGFVRAYAGEPTVSQMCARGPESPGRVDIPLKPGSNRVVVENELGRVVAKRE